MDAPNNPRLIPNTRGLNYIDDDLAVWKKLKSAAKPWKRLAFGRFQGYVVIRLTSAPGVNRVWKLHHLVLEVIKGEPRPEGMECRHLDGVRNNNHPDNLKWGTRKENNQDTVRHGRASLRMKGKSHSPEAKRKMSVAHQGKKFSRKHRKNMALAQIGKKASAEARIKMSVSHTGMTCSAEVRKKMSDAQKRRYAKSKSPD